MSDRRYLPPEQIGDGWDVGRVSQAAGDALVTALTDGTYHNIHSVVVSLGGKLVVDEYFGGPYEDGLEYTFDRAMSHCVHSCTKSVTSLLIGIAKDKGDIGSVDAPMSSFFPEYEDIWVDEKKRGITLHQYLSMTAGHRWDESSVPYYDPRNDHWGLSMSDDQARYTFELPLVAEPGSTFLYNSGISITIGEALHRATGVKADAFAMEHLFGPLGIENWQWFQLPSGFVQTGGGLYLQPRDMVKIGQLALDHGRWHGQQVVSDDWLAASTGKQAPDFEYGYQWWLGEGDVRGKKVWVFSAQGRGGQSITVVPELDAVAAITAWNDGTHGAQGGELLLNHVLPAILPA